MNRDKPQNGVAEHQQQKAQEQVNGLLQRDAAKGAKVHTFDPDATPKEKAASAGAARDNLKPPKQEHDAGREVALDPGPSSIVPTITIEDVDKANADEEEHPELRSSGGEIPATPGALPAGSSPAIPHWYKVGWRSVANFDAPPLQEGEEKDRSVLSLFLSEQFYGDWYHNAAIMIFAVFASHFLTRFNFGWGWLFIILAFCSTYYNISMTRFRRHSRDDIQRELVKTRLASEHESADWINNFLDRFWLIYEPVLAETIVSSVDQILSTSTPAFLDSLRLSTFTLGTKAPRIEKVRTWPNTEDDVVMMDWSISFMPSDTSNMTRRQAELKTNPKIVLSVRVGKGLASAALPVLLEDISFVGNMRVRLKLMTNFPHVQIVDISFLEKPVFDFVLKPVGGDTFGFDINHIPGLSAFIRDMVHATLGPMMYDPNVFTLNLEQLLSGTPLDSAIGVLQVTVEAARGLKGGKIGGGIPDPYVSININNREELARTKYKHSTYNPTWMETKFIIVKSLQESLILNVYDYNGHRKNTSLGSATFDMQKLIEDATQEGIELDLLKDGKNRGLLRFDLSYYPVLKPATVDGKEELPDTRVGIVRFTIHQAKDLDATKSMSGDLNPVAKLFLGNSSTPIHATSIFKHTNNPVWESSTEFLCSDKVASMLTVKVMDEREFLKDPVLGHLSVRLMDLLEAQKQAGKDWWPLSGCRSGRVRMSVEWKPLHMAGALSGADQYVPPIGVVRLWLQKAADVKNVEAALGGKSDPYVRVQINNITQGRTEVINNNLNPEWDQIIYIPVHSLKETMLLEVMDYQHLTKDRSLGTVELRVNELARASHSSHEYHYESTGRKQADDPIRLDGGSGNAYKGRLHYVAEFVPALALKGLRFDSADNELQSAAKSGTIDGEGDGEVVETDGDSGSSIHTAEERSEERNVTVNHPLKHSAKKSTDTTGTANTFETSESRKTSKTTSENGEEEEEEEEPGIEMSKAQLISKEHDSGIIIFNVISGQLHRKARLEVSLDDGYWPVFTTIKSRSTHARWQHVGEGFMKELDVGRVWLRLNASDGEKEEIIGEWQGDARPFLEATLGQRQTFTLKDQEDRTSTVEIETRYAPVPVKLEPRESVNNQGILRVTLMDGRDIRAADRGGKSDPFVVFTLNGQKVFKSTTKKKTVNPEWSERFEVSVPSRVAADFSAEVFDWNQIEQAKSLGSGKIDLANLELLEATERTVPLSSLHHGEKGEIRVSLVFTPQIIAKSRKNTSTFSAAGRAMTQIGSLPVGAGKGVIHGVGGIIRDFGRHEKQADDHVPPVPELPSGQASQPIGQGNTMGAANGYAASSVSEHTGLDGGPPTEPGTLRVTILDAKDLPNGDSKMYAVVRVGDKEYKTKHSGKTAVPEWNESFTCAASAYIPKVHVWIWDHKTLGKDKLLGEGEVDIWRHILSGSNPGADVFVELREGQGLLRLRLEFDPNTNPNGRSPSVHSYDRSNNMTSPSRFSLRGRRPDDN